MIMELKGEVMERLTNEEFIRFYKLSGEDVLQNFELELSELRIN